MMTPDGMVHDSTLIIKNYGKSKRFIAVLLISVLLFLSLLTTNAAFASTTFTVTDSNLSNTGANSITPRITASGNNVYVAWLEGDEIYFTNSTDNGVTFGTPINLSNTPVVTSFEPQISVSGNNVYVVWREDAAANDEVYLSKSNNNGDSFDAKIKLDSGAINSQDPQIVSSGNNAYVVWREGNEIFYTNSTDSGATFGTAIDLNAVAVPASVRTPQIAVSESNVYAIWCDGSNISFIRSTDNGDTFPLLPTTIGALGGTCSSQTTKPEIVASGSNVYAIWKQGVDIKFTNSTNNGASFDAAITLGNAAVLPNQQIAVSGSNVYVVWQNGANDISFIRSTNSGDTFEAEVPLTPTPEASALAQLAASGNNVFVVWREDTAVADDKVIRLISSTNNGAIFGGFTDLSSNTILSDQPDVASSGNNVYMVWSQRTSTLSTDGEIRFSAGVATPTTVVFDAAQYKLTSTATITVTENALNQNPAVAETIPGTVTSTSAPAGIAPILTETGINTGVFSGTITFTTGTSSGTILQANPGNTITATYGGVSGSATIFSRSVAWDSNPYDRGDTVFITVTDQNSNLNIGAAETIDVTVSSLVAGDSTTLTLTETGVNTGIFGGIDNVKLIFAEGNDEFPTSGTVTVTIESTIANADPLVVDATSVKVTSDSDPAPAGITLQVTETGINTSIFTGTLTLTTGSSVPASAIKVAGGDFVHVTKGAFTSNAIVVPNSDPAKGLLQVTITGLASETITATFGGVPAISSVDFTAGEPGGGGGGIVRPSLVLDIVAGIGFFTGGSGSSAKPTVSSTSLTFDAEPSFSQQGAMLESNEKIQEKILDDSSDTQVVAIGKKMELKLDMKENKGFENIIHVSLYFLSNGEKPDLKSSTYILYDKFEGITINDPNQVLDKATLELFKKDATTGFVKFSFAFDKPVGTRDFVIKAWDQERHANEWTFDDAITVVESSEKTNILSSEVVNEKETQGVESLLQQEKPEPSNIETVEQKAIPAWIKTSAKWWTQDQVSDSDFLLGVEYLIEEKIIQVPDTVVTQTASSQYVPDWFKNNAEWWQEGDLSDSEFTQGLQWLITNGVMKI